jgi:hypothetical protein
MKIFDGVDLKPTPSSNMQNWLSMAALVANSFIEAEKVRQERVEGSAGEGPMTLDDVMGQAGLKIPGLEEALTQFMGGGDEAKQAAAMIAQSPDPAALLQRFAQQFGLVNAANSSSTGPIVTPPPKFRPDLTREARQAARAASANSEPPNFRPDLTREARQAARAAAATGSKPEAARTAEAHAAGTDASTPTSAGRPSLVNLVERQLAALRQRMKAHEEALDARLKRAEAELAALRLELEQRAKPALVVAPAEERDGVEHATVEASEEEVAETHAELPLVLAAAAPSLACEEPLPVASEDEVVEAVGLISAFATECEERHQKDIARVLAVEHEIQVMRSRVQAEERAAHG